MEEPKKYNCENNKNCNNCNVTLGVPRVEFGCESNANILPAWRRHCVQKCVSVQSPEETRLHVYYQRHGSISLHMCLTVGLRLFDLSPGFCAASTTEQYIFHALSSLPPAAWIAMSAGGPRGSVPTTERSKPLRVHAVRGTLRRVDRTGAKGMWRRSWKATRAWPLAFSISFARLPVCVCVCVCQHERRSKTSVVWSTWPNKSSQAFLGMPVDD